MQKPLEDWHGRPNSLKASALPHWRVESMSTNSVQSSLQNRIHFNFSIPPMPFRDVYAIKTRDSKKGYVVKHLPSMDIVRTVYFSPFFSILFVLVFLLHNLVVMSPP